MTEKKYQIGIGDIMFDSNAEEKAPILPIEEMEKDAKVMPLLSKSKNESAKEATKIKTEPVLPKSIKIYLPDTLPLTYAEVDALDTLHKEALLENEERNKKVKSTLNIKVEKTQAEIKREIQTQKDKKWRKDWQIKIGEFKGKIPGIIPLVIEKEKSIFLPKSKEVLIKELKKKNIIFDESAERYLESNRFVIKNIDEIIKVIHIVPDSAKVDEAHITMEQMYDIAETLELKPCPDDAVLDLILQLRESAPDFKLSEANFNIFLNGGTVLNLKYNPKDKKMTVKLVFDVDDNSLCYFEKPTTETKE